MSPQKLKYIIKYKKDIQYYGKQPNKAPYSRPLVPRIETNILIYSANQLTGFYMNEALVVIWTNELIENLTYRKLLMNMFLMLVAVIIIYKLTKAKYIIQKKAKSYSQYREAEGTSDSWLMEHLTGKKVFLNILDLQSVGLSNS